LSEPGRHETKAPGGSAFDEAGDATRRTYLAGERTQLAWWRTGLTALAVALAVGRVVPELRDGGAQWPYSVIGAGFALYGVFLIAYGSARAGEVQRAVRAGEFIHARSAALRALTVGGILLGLATLVVVLVD
jgi:inner membrane protein YidH